MPELPLGCEDWDVIGGRAQAAPQRPCFGEVAQAGTGGMGLDGA